jgi:hypothetical protein
MSVGCYQDWSGTEINTNFVELFTWKLYKVPRRKHAASFLQTSQEYRYLFREQVKWKLNTAREQNAAFVNTDADIA